MPLSPPAYELIKVGYIDQINGYITINIEEANAYEKLNPKTVFIFVNGDGKIEYLTIAQVNQLTTNNLLSKNPCKTTPNPCGPPTLNFFGGAGIGAEGNPIIDSNGELIAVDLVNGGYGYQRPPFVRAVDPCNNGSGAVLNTIIEDGRVVDVIVEDSGQGYFPAPPSPSPRYPALLRLKEIVVKNPGINYNCGVDKMHLCINRGGTSVRNDNGTILSYQCDPFGKITSVQILVSGNFTERPFVCMETETGLNSQFTPVFEIIRDPLIPEVTRDLIQVFDLVGLRVQGYVDGKPYYGVVYFENQLKYAGLQNTGGKIIRVFETRQDSLPQ